jgi:hypothetical protein
MPQPGAFALQGATSRSGIRDQWGAEPNGHTLTHKAYVSEYAILTPVVRARILPGGMRSARAAANPGRERRVVGACLVDTRPGMARHESEAER